MNTSFCSSCNNFYDIVDYESTNEEKKKLNSSIFQCSRCNTKTYIPNGTVVYEKVIGNTRNAYKESNIYKLGKSNIMLRTREYTCFNKKCESHTNNKIKEASMFRLYNSAEVVYICNVCGTKC